MEERERRKGRGGEEVKGAQGGDRGGREEGWDRGISKDRPEIWRLGGQPTKNGSALPRRLQLFSN